MTRSQSVIPALSRNPVPGGCIQTGWLWQAGHSFSPYMAASRRIGIRRPHPSFWRTPDSCSAGTVPHPVPGCCRQLGLATAEPFSSLGVPVATGMSDSSGRPATTHRHTGEKPAPYSIRGRYPVPAPWIPVYVEAMVIPALSRIPASRNCHPVPGGCIQTGWLWASRAPPSALIRRHHGKLV